MSILVILGYIIGGLVGLIVLVIGFFRILGFLGDRRATKKAKRYCESKGYTFKKVELYPNHYGLFLSYQNMQVYAGFHYESDGSITWKKGSPEEKIAIRLKKKNKHNK